MGNSHHPKSTFTGIVKGENNRILRNCSKEQDYRETMEFLKNKFVNTKFPPQSISEPIIPFEQRQDLLLQNKFNSKDVNHITFVCPYRKEIKVCETLEGNWDIFSTNDTTRKRLINKQVKSNIHTCQQSVTEISQSQNDWYNFHRHSHIFCPSN